MKKFASMFLSFFFLMCFYTGLVTAQDDEARQSSGLPMMIGENSSNRDLAPLSGKLTIRGIDPSQSKPTFFVLVYFGSALIDKRQVNDSGHYYVPNAPRRNGSLAIEMGGVEIARYQLPLAIMGGIRQDIEINLSQQQTTIKKPGIISVKNTYQRSPENEKTFEKAVFAARDKKNSDAIKLFHELVKNDPKDFLAWLELGNLFFHNEKFSDAEAAYNKALEQKPDFTMAFINLGKLFLAQKQPDKAIPALTKAIEIEPDSADAQHFLGESYLQIKKGSSAVIHLNTAIKLAPIEKAEIHLRLAALYNAAGLKGKASEEYKLFLEKIPKHPEREKIEKYIKENPVK